MACCASVDAGRRSQALGRNRAHGRQRVLDAMMHLFENELLQLVGGLTLLGVDAGLGEQRLGIDDGLLQQQPKAVILGRQDRLRGGARRSRRALRPQAVWRPSGTTFSVPVPTISLQLGDHLLHFQRLAEEAAVRRLVGIGQFDLAGHQNDLDRRPAVVDGVGEFQSVHAAGHLNVRKQQRDVGARLENGKRFVGIDGLHRRESGILDKIDGPHAQHHLVLDHKNVGGRPACL